MARIRDGSFEDLYVGDYWETEDNRWLIADIDYFNNTWGDTRYRHLLIVPDYGLGTAPMNDTDTTNTGYINSKMAKEYIDEIAAPKIYSVFGEDNLYETQHLLSSSASNGSVEGFTYVAKKIVLMNEPMVFGSIIVRQSHINAYYMNGCQLALFRLNPLKIVEADRNVNYWLSDIASTNAFVSVVGNGTVASDLSNNSRLIRPIFAIK